MYNTKCIIHIVLYMYYTQGMNILIITYYKYYNVGARIKYIQYYAIIVKNYRYKLKIDYRIFKFV